MQLGIVGLGRMGGNIARRLMRAGHRTVVHDRNREAVVGLEGEGAQGAHDLGALVQKLKAPRAVWVMLPAGEPTEQTIAQLAELLEPGDAIIDGGNTFYKDDMRRAAELGKRGLHYLDVGTSGGVWGLDRGYCMMIGGEKAVFERLEPLFKALAPGVGDIPRTHGRSGEHQRAEHGYIHAGPPGAGHYVKMVHNGIEYGDMQLIAEAYSLLKGGLNLSNEELAETFTDWNKGELNSYLIDITKDIFTKKDEEGKYLVDVILDEAANKGTGKWTSQSSLDLGEPLSLITESVFARYISSLKEQRVAASKVLSGPQAKPAGEKAEFVEKVRRALYLGKIVSYAQGFSQLRAASDENNWDLNYGEIAKIFRAGCIIRAQFLQKITDAYAENAGIANLLLAPYFKKIADEYQQALRDVVAYAVQNGIPVPTFSAAVAYYDSYRAAVLPANLIQAQRDYFGAHTYKRTDKEGVFHTEWLD